MWLDGGSKLITEFDASGGLELDLFLSSALIDGPRKAHELGKSVDPIHQ